MEKNQMWNISRFLAVLHLSINQRRKGQSLTPRAFKAFLWPMKARPIKCMWILFERRLCINEDVLVGESLLSQVVTSPIKRNIDDEYQQRLDDLPTKVIVEEHINEDPMKLVPQVC